MELGELLKGARWEAESTWETTEPSQGGMEQMTRDHHLCRVVIHAWGEEKILDPNPHCCVE